MVSLPGYLWITASHDLVTTVTVSSSRGLSLCAQCMLDSAFRSELTPAPGTRRPHVSQPTRRLTA